MLFVLAYLFGFIELDLLYVIFIT